MLKAGKKHPLRENLVENLSGPRAKRGRFDNIVLLRNNNETEEDNVGNRTSNEPPRRILRAGNKRKRPTGEEFPEAIERGLPPVVASGPTPSDALSDENDIISQLTREFKKARLRPVFFTISSFIEQTVDEVGFTVADESAETEVTIRLNISKRTESDISTEVEENSGDNKNSDEEVKIESGSEDKPMLAKSKAMKNNVEDYIEVKNEGEFNLKVSLPIYVEEVHREPQACII